MTQLYPHLAVVSDDGSSPYMVRIIENVPANILFASCTATQRCIENYGCIEPEGKYAGPTNEWSCNECGRQFSTVRKTTDMIRKDTYQTLDGSWWAAVWLDIADHHSVQITTV